MALRLLAVDTATEICGVALAVDGGIDCELIVNGGGTHTRSVMAAVDAVLGVSRVSIDRIDGYVVTQGPGSFTGLRIGISTVKGLAVATDKPLVGISSLDVLAHQAGGDEALVCAMMDARRNEVYWRLYRRDQHEPVPLGPARVGPVGGLVAHIDTRCRFIGNGIRPYRQALEPILNAGARWTPENECGLRPSVLARLGWEKYRQGGAVDVSDFAPVYLRQSDAELNRGRS